jgi:hypothetical protein
VSKHFYVYLEVQIFLTSHYFVVVLYSSQVIVDGRKFLPLFNTSSTGSEPNLLSTFNKSFGDLIILITPFIDTVSPKVNYPILVTSLFANLSEVCKKAFIISYGVPVYFSDFSAIRKISVLVYTLPS